MCFADTDEDGDVDGQDNTTTPATANGSDYWTDMVYDDSWRIVATFRSGDAAASPRERFVYHCAGMDGKGSSSYIDAIVLRERSDATPWTNTTAPTSLSDRLYYLQNWRHDVIGLSKPNGQIVERPRYTSYGVPRTAAIGDFNHDGYIDDDDFSIFTASYNAVAVGYSLGSATTRGDEAWAVCDLNMDGVVDDADFGLFSPHYEDVVGVSGGHLSGRAHIQNVCGWSGHLHVLNGSHVSSRHRVFYAQAGTWTTRDRLHYADGMNVLEYVRSGPLRNVDPSGLNAVPVSPPSDQAPPSPSPYAPHDPGIDPFLSPPPGFVKDCPGPKHNCVNSETKCSPWQVVIRNRPRVIINYPTSMELTDHKKNVCNDRSTKCTGTAVRRTVEARECRIGADCTGSGEFKWRETRKSDSNPITVAGTVQPVGPYGQCLCVLSPGLSGGEKGYPLGTPPDWDIPFRDGPQYPPIPPQRAPGLRSR